VLAPFFFAIFLAFLGASTLCLLLFFLTFFRSKHNVLAPFFFRFFFKEQASCLLLFFFGIVKLPLFQDLDLGQF
jgi:hypothetical protein